jgi:protein phosphatase
MLEDQEMQAVLNRISDPQQCANTLVEGALVAGGLDNVTVVIVDVVGAGQRKRQRLAVRTKLTMVLLIMMLIAVVGGAVVGGYTYLHHAAYLAVDENGNVAVYQGAPGSVMGLSYSELVEDTDIPVDSLSPSAAESIRQGMSVESLEKARELVESYREELAGSSASASNAASAASSGSASAASASAASATSGNSAAPGNSASSDNAANSTDASATGTSGQSASAASAASGPSSQTAGGRS